MSDLLSSLLQCESRARLLHLLLVEKRDGSVSELARRADLSPRAIGKEVDHLASMRLVQVTTVGAARVVRAEWDNPACPLLAQLLQLEPYSVPEHREQVRESLAAFGAPLLGVVSKAHFTLETTVVKALQAAKKDGTLLRVLPVVFARNQNRLDWVELTEAARAAGVRSELGLLLELTGRQLADPQLREQSRHFKDRRKTRKRYLPDVSNRFEKKLAETSSPSLAHEWGFYMNLSEESVKSLLTKHCPDLTLA